MDFVITLEDWGRGDVYLLLEGSGKMCCLGFVSLQCGVSKRRIQNEGEPEDVKGKTPDLFKTILLTAEGQNNQFTRDAIAINDDEHITDRQRMRRLQMLAKQHGHSFTFVHRKEAKQ